MDIDDTGRPMMTDDMSPVSISMYNMLLALSISVDKLGNGHISACDWP